MFRCRRCGAVFKEALVYHSWSKYPENEDDFLMCPECGEICIEGAVEDAELNKKKESKEEQ